MINVLKEWVHILALNRDLQLSNHISDFIDCEVARLIQVEVAVDLLDKLGVVLGELQDTSTDFLDKHLNAGLCDGVAIGFGDLPGGLQHAHEVLVIRYAHGQVLVVVEKLLKGDCAVSVALSALEVVQELIEDLFLGLFHLDELGVHGYIVNLNDISEVDNTTAIAIK